MMKACQGGEHSLGEVEVDDRFPHGSGIKGLGGGPERAAQRGMDIRLAIEGPFEVGGWIVVELEGGCTDVMKDAGEANAMGGGMGIEQATEGGGESRGGAHDFIGFGEEVWDHASQVGEGILLIEEGG